MHSRRNEIATLLRRRILGELRAGTRAPGSRLPSTRELAHQLDSDPRVVLAAYRALAVEGLVELRPRSGIFLAPGAPALAAAAPPVSWLVEVLLDGIGHEVPAPALGSWISRATGSRTLRAVLAARTVDQREGIAQELRADFGLEVDVIPGDPTGAGEAPLAALLAGADVAVADPATAAVVQPVAARLGVPFVTASVGPDLLGDEWRRQRAHPLHVVHVDPCFDEVVRERLAGDPEALAGVRLLQLGRDDLRNIPAAAAVYVTRAARSRLDLQRVPGRHVAPARVLAPPAARALLQVIVAANLAASTETA